MRSNLTLNLGLRWETDTPIRDLKDRMNGFDMNATNPVSGTPGVVKFMGQNGFRNSPYDTDWNNFGPRAGFAWKPFAGGKTVVRAGGGVFFAHPFDRGAPTSASLGYEISAPSIRPITESPSRSTCKTASPGYNPTKPPLDDSFGAVKVGQATTTAVTFFEENRRTGYSMQWNFSIQREVAGILIESAYLANASRKLASANFPINQVRPEILGPASSQKDRPYPQFSNVTLVAPSFGVSNYHALALKAERRFSHGFSFFANYTWSKFLNNTDEGGSALGAENGYSNGYNRRADYGPSENDIPHRFNLSGVYELPFGKGRKLATGKFADAVFGGWGLGGVLTLPIGTALYRRDAGQHRLLRRRRAARRRPPQSEPARRLPDARPLVRHRRLRPARGIQVRQSGHQHPARRRDVEPRPFGHEGLGASPARAAKSNSAASSSTPSTTPISVCPAAPSPAPVSD